MTGAWLIVKWVGIAVDAFYLVPIVAAMWRFRRKLARMRSGFYLPVVLGSFVSAVVRFIFDDVVVMRVCFVVASATYIVGLVILVRGLLQADHAVLLKAGDAEEQIQSLKLS